MPIRPWTRRWPTCSARPTSWSTSRQPDTALENARACLEAGVHCVMGTSGADFSELEGVGEANLFFAPNFAIGAVLMIEAARMAAPHMPECEIVELHHDAKVDAPSGTAAHTASVLEGGRGERARADPLRAPAGPRGPSGGALRRGGADALHPPRHHLPRVVHARRAAGGAAGGRAGALADGRAGDAAVSAFLGATEPTPSAARRYSTAAPAAPRTECPSARRRSSRSCCRSGRSSWPTGTIAIWLR